MYAAGLVAPILLESFAMCSTHASNAYLRPKFSSLMTVTVQVSTVLSPATLKMRPLKGTSICAMLEAGSAADLHINWKVSASHDFLSASGNVVNSTSNRLGRAPPPINLDLNAERFLFALVAIVLLLL